MLLWEKSYASESGKIVTRLNNKKSTFVSTWTRKCLKFNLRAKARDSSSSSSDTFQLPSIDISPFLSSTSPLTSFNSARQDTAFQLTQACTRWGAFYLEPIQETSNSEEHGLTLEAARELMDLPLETLLEAKVKSGDGCVRGYIPLGGESGSADLVEIKQGFAYGYEWPMDQPTENRLQAGNRWPKDADPNTRAALNQWFTTCATISDALVSAFECALELPPESLKRSCQGGDTISMMRIFHYFPQNAGQESEKFDLANRIGSSPHTDWGFLTLVLQQPDVNGLEIWDNQEKCYRLVEPVDGKLVVNLGDYFSVMSGGKFLSPLHRVLLPPPEELVSDRPRADQGRISLIYFHYPNYDAKLASTEYSAAFERTSLSTNQHDIVDESLALSENELFGDMIWKKWVQVSRES